MFKCLCVCPNTNSFKAKCVVYEAAITETVSGKKETYTGLTSIQFKQRLIEHINDMRNSGSRIKSKLSSHVWDLKETGIDYEIKWKILERAPNIQPGNEKI